MEEQEENHLGKYLTLALWIISLLLVSYLLGVITKDNMNPWYDSLNRSSLTPPGYVFAIMWNILYILIAISGWLIWRVQPRDQLAERLYITQLILNWIWTPIFFFYHAPTASLICLCLLWLTVVLLTIRLHRVSRPAMFMMCPYLLWSTFATYLNWHIVHYAG